MESELPARRYAVGCCTITLRFAPTLATFMLRTSIFAKSLSSESPDAVTRRFINVRMYFAPPFPIVLSISFLTVSTFPFSLPFSCFFL